MRLGISPFTLMHIFDWSFRSQHLFAYKLGIINKFLEIAEPDRKATLIRFVILERFN